MTQSIVDITKPLGVAVHDHIIVGKDGQADLEWRTPTATTRNRRLAFERTANVRGTKRSR